MLKRKKYLNKLFKWSESTTSKPLVLRGARQVGKTSLVRDFGENNFKNYIEINLEKDIFSVLLNKKFSVEEFENIVSQITQKKFIPHQTLFFIDEVQSNPHVYSLLRYYYEERSDIKVIAAGSLLEPYLKRAKVSMPVGRIEFIYIHPFDFFEYLEFFGKNTLLNKLEEHNLCTQIPEIEHTLFLKEFRKYMILGGMPGPLNNYKNEGLGSLRKSYSDLFQTYRDDIYKYAFPEEADVIYQVLVNAPYFAGQEFKYENFAQLGFSSKKIKRAFNKLKQVKLLNLIQPTISKQAPLMGKRKHQKKLLFLDVGFYSHLNNISPNVSFNDLASFYRGSGIEQVVLQNIYAQDLFYNKDMFFWKNNNRNGGGTASLDYTDFKGTKIFGVEIKAGSGRRAKSIPVFLDAVKNSYAIKFYTKNIDFSMSKRLIKLPLYLSPRINEVCNLFL